MLYSLRLLIPCAGNGLTDFHIMLAACVDTQCTSAAVFSLSRIFMKQVLPRCKNPYDINKDCDGPIKETTCYSKRSYYISSFLDHPSVREKLGMVPSVTGNFSFCSDTVRQAFVSTMDEYHATDTHRHVRALIFAGPYATGLWSDKQAFGQQPLRSWLVEGEVVGKTRSAKGLTFAAWMVSYDKPKEALAVVQRWLTVSDL
ncbi:Alpha/Beta hydrolase protein [Suillus lakei]|nr:Alpha/Beta hydrolase protein [Suillus lakei]